MSKPTLAEWLAGVKERCEKATKGPWESYCIPRGQYPMYGVAQTTGDKLVVCDMSGVDAPEANANHIAHSRADVEVLVGMVEAFLAYLEETDGEWHPLNNLHNKLDILIPPAEEAKP